MFNSNASMIADYFTPTQSPMVGSSFSTPAQSNSTFWIPEQSSAFETPTQNAAFSASAQSSVFSTQGPQFSTPGQNTVFSTQGPQFSTPGQNATYSTPTQNSQFPTPTQNSQFPTPTQNSQFPTLIPIAQPLPYSTAGVKAVPHDMPVPLTVPSDMAVADLRQQLSGQERHVSESWENCILL
jgi:hypothetical protein